MPDVSTLGWVAAALALGAFAFWRLQRAALRSTLRARREHAADGELRAESMLTNAGYRVIGRQVAGSYAVRVDGEATTFDVRADYIVEAGARRFVAEVKTGHFAPRLATAATRRQLLEYRLAYDVDGVLLVDADAERVLSIDFQLEPPNREARPSRLAWLVAGVALGVLGAAALEMHGVPRR